MYLFRIEGVNLSSVLFDTSEISVLRGASFMLRKCTKEIPDKFKELTAISVGASVGLYSYEGDEQGASDLHAELITHINEHYKYLSFVIDYLPYDENKDFKTQLDQLVVKNRHQQFKQATLYPQPLNETNAVCEMSKIHAQDGKEISKAQDNISRVSNSVQARYEFGKSQKHNYYSAELAILDLKDAEKETIKKAISEYKFTNDLSQIAKNPAFGNLHNKIAVIYIDGNHFNKELQKCSSADSLRNADTGIQEQRAEFLHALLELANGDPDFKNNGNIRLETLLWGGDEMTFVVPAWKGLEVVNLFYQCAKKWTLDIDNDKIPLTHACGLVFSNHKTPIKQLEKTARALADDLAKEQDRSLNLCRYLTLESEYYPTEESIIDFFAKRYQKQSEHIKSIQFPLTNGTPHSENTQSYTDFQQSLVEQLKNVPKSSLYAATSAYINEEINPAKKHLEHAKSDMRQEVYQKLTDTLLCKLNHASGNDNDNFPAIVHLVELWDYLLCTQPTPNTKET